MGRLLNVLAASLRRGRSRQDDLQTGGISAPGSGSPPEREGVDHPAEEGTLEASWRSFGLLLSTGVIGGVLLSLLPTPLAMDEYPQWPPESLSLTDAVAALAVLTTVVLGVVIEGRGAAERISALGRSDPSVREADVRHLTHRWEVAAGLSGVAAVFAVVVGTVGLLGLAGGRPLGAVVIALLTALVVSLSRFSSVTTLEARRALRREAEQRRHAQVQSLRRAEAHWRQEHRPPARHGRWRFRLSVAVPVVVLLSSSAYAWQQPSPGPNVAVVLAGSSVLPPLASFAVYRVVRAGAAQEVGMRVVLWIGIGLLWVLGSLLVVVSSSGPGAPWWWWLSASITLLLAHVVVVVWSLCGLVGAVGTARYLRTPVASYLRGRIERLEADEGDSPRSRTQGPTTRVGRYWSSMSGRATDDDVPLLR